MIGDGAARRRRWRSSSRAATAARPGSRRSASPAATRPLLRAGALTAAYAAAIEDARRIGAETFDSGRCSPRADDPIAAYKARWGLRPEPDPLIPVYALRARTPEGERCLARLPVSRP